jgi:bifunctional non-homologous end joining protein LigD
MVKEPMPQKIIPMLAKMGEMPANDGDYGFEMKWDGIRAILYIDHSRARLASRNLLDITGQYPEVLHLAESPGASQLILDGEIVALGDDARPSFGRLQNRMGVVSDESVRRLMVTIPVTYMIFDMLYRDGASLMSEPYIKRREVLSGLRLSGSAWQTPDYAAGNGPTVQGISRQLGLEGVVFKHLNSPYQPGRRSGAWLKLKNQLRQELVIGGWIPGSGTRSGMIGALLVGYYEAAKPSADTAPLYQGLKPNVILNVSSSPVLLSAGSGTGQCDPEQQLVYAGKVGTGFTDLTLDRLAEALRPLRRATSPFYQCPGEKGAVFVEPLLVCEVEFTQWTTHNIMRHPSFKGLRTDKGPRDVVREA